MAAIFVILYQDGTKYVEARDSSMSGFYQTVVLSLVVLWTCYPVVRPWCMALHFWAAEACMQLCIWLYLFVLFNCSKCCLLLGCRSVLRAKSVEE